MLQLPLDVQLDGAARLDNFFVGENQQLFKRLQDLGSTDGELYFIWGSEQVGKSHLAQAICREMSECGKIAAYIPLDNRQIQPAILDGLEFADLVCLDVLDAVVERADWEEALFDLFNRLKSAERNLVIFSRKPLSVLSIQLADLRSRLSSMEVYKLNAVNSESRAEFIISVGRSRGLDISLEVANFLLSRTERDVVKLLEIVELLDRQSLTHQRKITIPFVKAMLTL